MNVRYIPYRENFQGDSVFQGKRKLLKNPECKKYIQYSEKFQGKRELLKNPEWQNMFQYSEKFQGKLCFSGQAQVAQKFRMINISIQWKIPGQLCFSGQARVAQNLECKKYIQYSKKFWATLFFRTSAVAEKSWIVKNIFNAVKIFRAAASYSKIVNCEKIFNAVYIHLGAIRVIWASVVCNQDQRRDWL